MHRFVCVAAPPRKKGLSAFLLILDAEELEIDGGERVGLKIDARSSFCMLAHFSPADQSTSITAERKHVQMTHRLIESVLRHQSRAGKGNRQQELKLKESGEDKFQCGGERKGESDRLTCDAMHLSRHIIILLDARLTQRGKQEGE